MPKSLDVDPIDLFHSSNQLAVHRADHMDVHESANLCIETAATSGWVGASSAALKGKLADLRAVTLTISDALEHHSAAFHRGGLHYLGTDSDSAETLATQMSSFGDTDPR